MTIELKTATGKPVATVNAFQMETDGREIWATKLDGELFEVWNIRHDSKTGKNWSQHFSPHRFG